MFQQPTQKPRALLDSRCRNSNHEVMLKTIFNCSRLWLILVALVLLRSQQASAAEPGVTDAARSTQQVAALLDYVAADYSHAVADGKVLDESEYAEQQNLLAEARKLAAVLPGEVGAQKALLTQVDAVVSAVAQKASGAQVQAQCRAVRQTLKDAFQLRMVPGDALSATSAATQFGMLCSSCHGVSGRGDGPAGKALKPPPVSFHDAERMSEVAPSLAFHTLTFGIPGTSMASFDVLSARDRWNLAFYVVALRHGTPGATASGEQPEAVRFWGPPAKQAELSDKELLEQLKRSGLDDAASVAGLRYLRTSAPFAVAATGSDKFSKARELMAEMVTAAQKGDVSSAHRLAIAAYLDGIEPHEAGLKAQHPQLVARIEAAFMALREATTEPKVMDVATLQQKVRAAEALLTEALQEKKSSPTAAFLAALIIALREGLEVALLIAALLAFLRKSGQAQLSRMVHLGWLLAVPAGLLTFLAVGAALSGAQRELAEAITTLFAAVILVTMTHWVVGAQEAKHWLGFLRRKVEAVGAKEGATQGRSLALLGLSFFAAYREAFETVLFYRALLLDAGPSSWQLVAMGALTGALIMVAVVLVVGRIGKKLNPRPVMLASSVLLALLSLSLTGHGIHSLQEGGYLTLTPIQLGAGEPWGGLPTLGLYASWQGVLAQLLVVALLLVPSLVQRLRGTSPPAQQPPAGKP